MPPCLSRAAGPGRALTQPCTAVSRLDGVSWRVDYALSSSELQEVGEPLVHLLLRVRHREHGEPEAVPMAVSAEKFRVLLAGEDGLELGPREPRPLAQGSPGPLSNAPRCGPVRHLHPAELKQAQALMKTLL